MELGMKFSEREIPSGHGLRELDLGREGGHSKRRILHAKDITGREDTWQTEPADAIFSLEQKDTDGIIGVHSGSDKIGSDGKAYSTW